MIAFKSVKWSAQLFATLWTVAYQASPAMRFSRQGYWSGLPFPSPGDLSNIGIELRSLAPQADYLPTEPAGRPHPGGGHGSPLQSSCPENPVGRGAWWAAVHRLAKSRTWLKQLSNLSWPQMEQKSHPSEPCLNSSPTKSGDKMVVCFKSLIFGLICFEVTDNKATAKNRTNPSKE